MEQPVHATRVRQSLIKDAHVAAMHSRFHNIQSNFCWNDLGQSHLQV